VLIPVYVFAKPPQPGVSKTRLAADLGPEAAAAFARALLVDLIHGLRAQGWDVRVATPDPDHPIWVSLGVPAVDHGGGDLGQKMLRVLGQHERALAIGADVPLPPRELLEGAARALEDHDAALIPAEDGGYVVFATRSAGMDWLPAIRWSSEHTLRDTARAFDQAGRQLAMVGRAYDVDDVGDLVRLSTDPVLPQLPQTRLALAHWEMAISRVVSRGDFR